MVVQGRDVVFLFAAIVLISGISNSPLSGITMFPFGYFFCFILYWVLKIIFPGTQLLVSYWGHLTSPGLFISAKHLLVQVGANLTVSDRPRDTILMGSISVVIPHHPDLFRSPILVKLGLGHQFWPTSRPWLWDLTGRIIENPTPGIGIWTWVWLFSIILGQ